MPVPGCTRPAGRGALLRDSFPVFGTGSPGYSIRERAADGPIRAPVLEGARPVGRVVLPSHTCVVRGSSLPERQRALIQRLRLLILPLFAVDIAQPIQRKVQLRMVRSQRLFSDAQSSLVERFCLFVLPLVVVK